MYVCMYVGYFFFFLPIIIFSSPDRNRFRSVSACVRERREFVLVRASCLNLGNLMNVHDSSGRALQRRVKSSPDRPTDGETENEWEKGREERERGRERFFYYFVGIFFLLLLVFFHYNFSFLYNPFTPPRRRGIATFDGGHDDGSIRSIISRCRTDAACFREKTLPNCRSR